MEKFLAVSYSPWRGCVGRVSRRVVRVAKTGKRESDKPRDEKMGRSCMRISCNTDEMVFNV